MAQRTVTTLVDDLDGTEAEETLSFALDGVTYEIDLSDTNAKGLRDSLEPYRTQARRRPGQSARRRAGTSASRPSAGGTTTADREQNQAVRLWARGQGYDVSARGRIPAHVTEAYHQQH